METNLIIPKRENMVDVMNRPLTQSLFLELGYTDASVYTLKDDHHEYKGRVYPSLRKLYLETSDPTEYEFANKYLINWSHWLRLTENKVIRKFIDEWREELEVKIRAEGYRYLHASARGGNYQAAKYLSDKGWDVRKAGRPSKEEVERNKKIGERIDEEYKADVLRMSDYG